MTQTTRRPERSSGLKRPREPLTRERIVEVALRVMDADGLEAVTMRRIGRELGVEAMSLYNHVEDKEDILDRVTEMVMAKFEIPAPTGDWVADMKTAAREWRRVLRLHPNVMRLLAERHKPLESLDSFRPMEAALEVISRGGFSMREVVQAFNAFGGYIMGFVMMEQGLMLGRSHEHGLEPEADELVRALAQADLPRLLEALPHFVECSTDEQFNFGLDLLIEGLRARMAPGG